MSIKLRPWQEEAMRALRDGNVKTPIMLTQKIGRSIRGLEDTEGKFIWTEEDISK